MTTSRFSRAQLFQNRAYKTVMRPGLVTDLPAAAFDIFNIAGSPVMVFGLFGVVTTAIGATAAVCRLQYTAAIAGAAQTPLCAAHATMINDPAGTIYYWSGLQAGLLVDNAAIAATSDEGWLDLTTTPWDGNYILVCPGVIAVTNAVAGTGIIDWYISYLPLLDAGIVTAL